MKVLILSWEYPPRSIGGISTHVYNLSHSLTKAGNEVHVVTCEIEGSAAYEDDYGVRVHRVKPFDIVAGDFAQWVNHLNYAMIEKAISILKKEGKFDLIHAHDWLVGYAAKTVKDIFNLPLVTTIHSTEHGRNNGIHTDLQRYIASVENFIINESSKLICCSNYMKEQVLSQFNFDSNSITVIPNGVHYEKDKSEDILSFRRTYAKDDEKVIFFIGRHTYEKGIHTLIEALPMVTSELGGIKLVIAGAGPMTEELKYKAYISGLSNRVIFTGYLDDKEKELFYQLSDVNVIPSLYEPFGIVALEAMSKGCPVLASDTGGLPEIVIHNVTGKLFSAGSAVDLACKIEEILTEEIVKSTITESAFNLVRDKYNWDKAAAETTEVYKLLTPRRRRTSSKKTERKDAADSNKVPKTSKEEAAVKSETKKPRKSTRRVKENISE